MREQIEALALRAGKGIMEYYPVPSHHVSRKDDGSPVTAADLAAHTIILEGLQELSPLPIVSEESYEASDFPPADSFWLVDPLDGTRDFINNTHHFTVNIALIQEGVATAGVIYAPVSGDVYSAFDGQACKGGKPLHSSPVNHPMIAGSSRFHRSSSLQDFLEKNKISEVMAVGSSLKFCLLAEGVLDIYPRLSPTSQWDTAAGQAIAEAAGCVVVDHRTGHPLRYGSHPIKNPSFIASKRDLYWV